MLIRRFKWILPVALASLPACTGRCGEGTASGEEDEAAGSSWYRGAIAGEHGEVPFFLKIPGPGEEGEVEIRNGSDLLTAEHRWDGRELTILFPHWGTSLEAEKMASGELQGVWIASRLFNQFEAPFTAEPVSEPDPRRRFPGQAAPDVEIDGSWRTDFSQSGSAEMRLRSVDPGVVEGTIVQRVLSGGDFGTLAGNVRGDELLLSTFDGQKAFRLSARAGGSQMIGRWEFVGLWNEQFIAVRGEFDERASVFPVGAHNRYIDVPGLDDPRYEGKPVIVGLFGTWCTTCGDLAPVIRDLYERYRDRGLEVHAVAYEVVDDAAYIARQIATYRERYGADWPIVVVSGEVESQLPPELQGLGVLPITMFRNPDGSMHAIRTGFVSPASGDEHTRQVAEFEELTRAIVNADS
jgi:thiol-disulfide isomerase/thioredoxin